MKEITEITSQKKGDRLNIFLDGQFAFGVEYATAVKFSLKKGVELSDEDIASIFAEEGNTAAFNRGLKYAVKKVVTQRQMLDYLSRNGFSDEAGSLAVEKLKSYGYVDDAAFAKAYVGTYGKERGAKRIEFELKKTGVKSEVIAEALNDLDEEDSCLRCLDKYLRTRKNTDRQKIINYLVYRGFDWDDINNALSRREL